MIAALFDYIRASLKADDTIDQLRTNLHYEGIKMNYDVDKKSTRIILSAETNNKKVISMPIAAYNYCNGIVFSVENNKPLIDSEWKLLCISSPFYTRSIPANHISRINRLLLKGSYKVKHIVDGSTFNLYYYDGRWVLSSSSGIDVGDKKIHENALSFMEILKDAYGEGDKLFDLLDPDFSYTFIIRHEELRKFEKGKIFHFVHKANLKTQQVTTDDEHFGNMLQPVVEKYPKNLSEYFQLSYNSFQEYKKNGYCYFGSILESEHENDSFRFIMLESKLFRTIRNFRYKKNLQKIAREENYDFETVCALNAYIGAGDDRDNYFTLFDSDDNNVGETYEFFKQKIDNLIKDVCTCLESNVRVHKNPIVVKFLSDIYELKKNKKIDKDKLVSFVKPNILQRDNLDTLLHYIYAN